MEGLQAFKRGLLIALAGLVAGLLSSSAVFAIDNAGIGGKPAHPRADNPRSQSIFVYELKPGDHIDDAVKVINNTDKQKSLLVYAVDSQVASDGAFACAQKVDSPVSVGTWISLAKDKVTLAANASEDVPFSLTVPKTASAGEQNGCIVIQDSEQSPAPQGNGVTLSFRSAIRVAVTVPGDITKELDFTGPVAVKVEKDTIRLSAGLKNNGNVSLDSEINTHIKNIAGGTVRTAGGTFPVLAHSQAAFNFEVKKPFWGGWYAVNASATYDSDLSQSIGESGQKKTINSPKKWVFVAPKPAALLIELAALIVLLGTSVILFMRKRNHKKLHAEAILYKAKKNQSLQEIAKKHDVSWKTIAKLNKLKPPYHIEAGQELKIPAKARSDSKHGNKKVKLD